MTLPRARRGLGRMLYAVALVIVLGLPGPPRASAVEIGQPAPDFKLPSTLGNDVALSDYRGKKWVLIEFYGVDFSPA